MRSIEPLSPDSSGSTPDRSHSVLLMELARALSRIGRFAVHGLNRVVDVSFYLQ